MLKFSIKCQIPAGICPLDTNIINEFLIKKKNIFSPVLDCQVDEIMGSILCCFLLKYKSSENHFYKSRKKLQKVNFKIRIDGYCSVVLFSIDTIHHVVSLMKIRLFAFTKPWKKIFSHTMYV